MYCKSGVFVCKRKYFRLQCMCLLHDQPIIREWIQLYLDFQWEIVSSYLLGRGRLSTIVGVETGVFFVALFVAVVAGAALPDRICRFGDPSTFDGVGPTDCDRSAYG